MPPVMLRRVSGFPVLAGAAMCLLATSATSVSPETHPSSRPSPPAAHTRTIKRTWQTGPATMPLETEVVPPHPSSAPPAIRVQAFGMQGEKVEKAGGDTAAGSHPGSTLVATRASTTLIKPENRVREQSQSSPVDPQRRERDDLSRLRTDPGARQAFYEDLRRTAEAVRAEDRVQQHDPARPTTPSSWHAFTRPNL